MRNKPVGVGGNDDSNSGAISSILFKKGDEWVVVGDDQKSINHMIEYSQQLAQWAWEQDDEAALIEIHEKLASWYNDAFNVPVDHRNAAQQAISLYAAQKLFEKKVLENEISQIDLSVLRDAPRTGKEFVTWLRQQISSHPARLHEYYSTYLKDYSTLEDLQDFLLQETSLDPRFDDVLALMQVGTSGNTKMEIAQNYWDEMGNGDHAQVHSKLFSTVLKSAGIDLPARKNDLYHESNVCGNISVLMALHRSNFYKAVGYFGVTEFLAPSRFKHVVAAWERLGLPSEDIEYHRLHIRIDTVHANAWFNNVVAPLVDENPANGFDIALGALIRLNTSDRYLDKLLYEAKKRSTQYSQ